MAKQLKLLNWKQNLKVFQKRTQSDSKVSNWKLLDFINVIFSVIKRQSIVLTIMDSLTLGHPFLHLDSVQIYAGLDLFIFMEYDKKWIHYSLINRTRRWRYFFLDYHFVRRVFFLRERLLLHCYLPIQIICCLNYADCFDIWQGSDVMTCSRYIFICLIKCQRYNVGCPST